MGLFFDRETVSGVDFAGFVERISVWNVARSVYRGWLVFFGSFG